MFVFMWVYASAKKIIGDIGMLSNSRWFLTSSTEKVKW